MTFCESVLICIGKVDKYEFGEADYEYFKDGSIDVCNLPIREWVKMCIDDIFWKCINMYRESW